MDGIDPFPWFLNKDVALKFGGRETVMHIRASEWNDCWRPFLTQLAELQKQHSQRLMVAVVGPPGSGKSFFAAQIAWMASKGFIPGSEAIALPMDGFHFPGHILNQKTLLMRNGDRIPMIDCKGAPETIDVESLRGLLGHIRRCDEKLTWPDYDRKLHDIVPHALRISASHNLILVEGNYLLVKVPPYRGIADMFDLRVYVEAPGPTIVTNLMNRHMAGGKTVEQAKDWVRRIDLPNARLVESTRPLADVVIQRDRTDLLSAVIWRDAPVPAENALKPD